MTEEEHFDDPKTPLVVGVNLGRQPHRETTFIIGRLYEVKPLNPQRKKNRGRRGELVGYIYDEGGTTLRKARVRWLDSGRIGHEEFADLVMVEGCNG